MTSYLLLLTIRLNVAAPAQASSTCSSSVPATEAVFVGDDPRWDIIGAEQTGLRPILLSPGRKLDTTGCTVIGGLGEVLEVINAAPNLGAA
jgi:hypothetical protein